MANQKHPPLRRVRRHDQRKASGTAIEPRVTLQVRGHYRVEPGTAETGGRRLLIRDLHRQAVRPRTMGEKPFQRRTAMARNDRH